MFLPLREIKNKRVHRMLDDVEGDVYCEIIEKQLDYSDENDELVFSTKMKFVLVKVYEEDEIIDAFAAPLIPFTIRTEEDLKALKEIYDELQKDDMPCDA